MVWERTEYKKILDGMNNEFISKINSASNENELKSISTEVSTKFMTMIRDFFSSDGEGNLIKKLYASVNGYTTKPKKIDIQDINSSNSMYLNYLKGMDIFIFGNIQNNSSSMIDTITKYIDKDRSFIESLFNNGTNTKYIQGVTIQEALGNLEVLIDFIPRLEKCEGYIERIVNQCVVCPDSSNNCKQLMKMYLLSLVRFSTSVITGVFDSFYQIVNAINTPVVDLKKESVVEEPFLLLL